MTLTDFATASRSFAEEPGGRAGEGEDSTIEDAPLLFCAAAFTQNNAVAKTASPQVVMAQLPRKCRA
jgi:hypothetical protein